MYTQLKLIFTISVTHAPSGGSTAHLMPHPGYEGEEMT